MNCSCKLEAEYADAPSTILALRLSLREKRLLMLHVNPPHETRAVSRLSVSFPGWPIVALVAEDFHPNGFRGHGIVGPIRAGASHIVTLPFEPDDFKEVLDRIAAQFVDVLKKSKAIAVAGATGGTGATTIAINLTSEIADHLHLRCILVDLSVRMGVVAPHLNIEPTHSILDLLRDIHRVDAAVVEKVLTRFSENFEILAGPHEFAPPLAISTQDVAHVIDTLEQTAAVVVLDVPCTYDDIYFDVLASAAQVVLVGEQNLPSIRALRMVSERLGRDAATVHMVINRFDRENQGFGVERLLKPLGVSSLHTVARDHLAVSAAGDNGVVLRQAAPRSRALTDISALAKTLMALEPPVGVKPLGLFSRLGRALTNK